MRTSRHNWLSKRRNVTELSHQSQSVPSSVRIENLAVRDVVNRDSLHGYLPARGRNIRELAFVSAGKRPGGNNFPLFGDHVFNCEPKIGKAICELAHPPLVQL